MNGNRKMLLHLLLLLGAGGILTFGIVMMKIAYDLPNPFEFLITFFSASLVILMGGVLCLGACLRLREELRKR